MKFFALTALLCLNYSAGDVSLSIENKADIALNLSWINIWKENSLFLQRQEPLEPSGSMNINSFTGHSFLVHRIDSSKKNHNPKGNLENDEAVFTVGAYDERITITRDQNGKLAVEQLNSLNKAYEIIGKGSESCGLSELRSNTTESAVISQKSLQCLDSFLAKEVADLEQRASRNQKLNIKVGDRLRNYTCADPLMETSQTDRKFTWRNRNVDKFYDRESTKILLIDNFVSDEECESIIGQAEKIGLRAATVNGPTGADLSSSRRAKACLINPKFSANGIEDEEDNIAKLFRRGYDFANEQTGYGLKLDGQEGFSVIKYDPTDEYVPHCDGDCTGVPYKMGGRVATMVLYCHAAEVGGGTTFSNVDVFIKPKKGQAAFFSYYDPEKDITDDGFTKHSGCPIISGTKWIATLWMRLGVSSTNTYLNYTPDGSLKPKKEPLKEKNDQTSEDGLSSFKNEL